MGKLRISYVVAFLATVLSLVNACGYHPAGSASHLPPDVHTIAVKFIENKTSRYHSEIDITQAIVAELQTRTRDKIVPASEDADATLSGVILTETVAPYTYNSNTGQTSSYLITVTANITLTDRNNRVLYHHDDYQFHQQYEATADLASFIQEDSPAEKRLARDFAQTLVGDMLESF
jgi:outer membrane lipopolysaccharide assembly protein LptE/RlpB